MSGQHARAPPAGERALDRGRMLKDGCDIAVTVDEVHTTMPDGAARRGPARHLIEGGPMGASLKFGIPNVSFETGDHICGFYRGRAERDEILFPYLRAGL